jgi:DNA-binding NarL/FixJ family response regulator
MNPQRNSGSCRVVVVYESGFIREGLCQVIERFADIEVVASIYSSQQLDEVTRKLRVDVILIDAQLPSQTAFEAARRLRKSGANVGIVILSVNPSLAEVRQAIQAGAHGFLLREAGVSELEVALHAAVRGENFLCPTILKRLSHELALEERNQSDSTYIDSPKTATRLTISLAKHSASGSCDKINDQGFYLY